MRHLNEPTVTYRWQPKPVFVPYLQGELDTGQRQVEVLTTDTDVLLTENDLNFFPTQKQLDELTFYAPKAVYDKLYKPFFHKRTANKSGKVTGTELKLKLLEDKSDKHT